jgi:hypothetical protein
MTRSFKYVYMYFDNSWTDRLSMLKHGNPITVVGEISEIGRPLMRLRNCELEYWSEPARKRAVLGANGPIRRSSSYPSNQHRTPTRSLRPVHGHNSVTSDHSRPTGQRKLATDADPRALPDPGPADCSGTEGCRRIIK